MIRFIGKTINAGRGRIYVYIPRKIQEKYDIKPGETYVIEMKGPITEEDIVKLVEKE